MKTGKPPRLSEKLNADLDTLRQEHSALMNSQLETAIHLNGIKKYFLKHTYVIRVGISTQLGAIS